MSTRPTKSCSKLFV